MKNSKLQAPTSREAPSFKRLVGRVTPCAPPIANRRVLIHHDGARGATRPTRLFGAWNFSGCWRLVLGASAQFN